MPRSMACASSGAHIIGSTHATCGLTAKPPGTQRSLSLIAWYSSTHALASSGSTKEKLSAPMPFSAARRIVSRREEATHSGGWGFWTGLWEALRGWRGAAGGGGGWARGGLQKEGAVGAGERLLDHHPRDDSEQLLPLRAL